MSSFDDRERAEEAKFAMDEATEFKVMARRNKLLGMWAADLMDLHGDDAEAYAKTVVISDLEEAGDDDVFRKVRADLDKASVDNERNGLAIRMADGRDLAVVQIAGLVARRILCFTQKDRILATGQRFGLIRFGSRLDVYLPDGVEPLVAIGQTMVAGESIIADLATSEPRRGARAE